MKDTLREKLFESIVKDDVKRFGEVYSEFLGVVFGRFPLLSLLYLYGAKRIVKRYFADLVKERPRDRREPILAAEERFRKVAGKALRFFLAVENPSPVKNAKSFDEREVSPLEMLAVLGKGRELKKLFRVYPGAPRYVPSIHRIYLARVGEGVSVKDNEITLPAERLSYEQKRMRSSLAWIFLAVGVFFTVVTVTLSVLFGLGNDHVYYKARSGTALANAMGQNMSVFLKKDVELSYTADRFGRQMEGDGHVVRLSKPFAKNFSGNMRNVIFVLSSDFEGDAVILCNTGTLTNVRVVAEGLVKEKGDQESVGLLTSVNKGTVEGCYAVYSITFTGEGGSNCFFAPIAGSNEGVIHDCRSDGTITATNVDVAGVVGKNEKEGKVLDCTVSLEAVQNGDIEGWNPNVAGVVVQNEGTVFGCVVTGSVTSVLEGPLLEEDVTPASALAGGIVCENEGSVKNCVNQSIVKALSTNGGAKGAGIAVQNVGEIVDCECNEEIYAQLLGSELKGAEQGVYAYAAGIACINVGNVDNCTNKKKVSAQAEEGVAVSGGLVALNDISSQNVEQKGSVSACVSQGESVAYSSTHSALAGGVVAVNSGCTIADNLNEGAVSADAPEAGALAGGIVAKNVTAVIPIQVYGGTMKQSVSAVVNKCAGSGKVTATSKTGSVYAGGIAGVNEENCYLVACRQSGSVSAGSEGAYDYAGGIVGFSAGIVTTSFFIGTLESGDEDSFVGAICGLTYLVRELYFANLTLRISNCAYLKDNVYACGALVYNSNLYPASYFEQSENDSVDMLEYGSTAVASLEELKALDIYYD